MTMPKYRTADVAILIGRFQPFHNGHAALLERALQSAPEVIVILGSAFHARNPRNPFTWQERAAMIANTLSASDRERVSYIPLRDYYDDKRWARAVLNAVAEKTRAAASVALIGHFKDASSQYLRHFPLWNLIEVGNQADIDATNIRQVLFEADSLDISLDVVAGSIPEAIRHYLKAWALLPCYGELVQEHAVLREYKASWSSAPYPPIFTTVDAVVRTAGHVLLIRRRHHPGLGLRALPGGFVEQSERLLQAAIRELEEETTLGVLSGTLPDALVAVAVFDHPERSLRGRTITHAHFFDLKHEQLPEVEAADDAASAGWVAIEELAGMEEQFFDDHFHILDHFLQLTKD
ncbi:MAG TPA: bifunctional nicotinamide-nucleotide adenylyltransferase/Nudix hydroxylase [Undibacterium sp.]|nr:bifunctional nicotinamide-nucleotide adenylyltransferase/Nudix hydroxylase [Undibacterium sp.]HTD02611.1 bifunctional nicotinamide-nucleotide adenylyltransferase/Nudix hydroxylase [Undibacterium sp.]